MTKEELEKEAEEYAREWLYHVKDLELHHKEDDKPEYIRIKQAYLAGAEPREKQIAELEKENARLKEINTHTLSQLNLDNGELIIKNEKLRKENAELKKRVDNQKSFLERIRAKFNLGKIDRKEIEGYLESDNLTKAKEIIKLLLWDLRNKEFDPVIDVNRAEQYLKELDK